MRAVVSFIGLMILWMLMTWSVDPQQIVTGAVVAALLSLLLYRLYRQGTWRLLDPMRWLWFVVYAIYFLYCCVRANLDVAYRALHPDVPIRPGIVKISTDLHTDIAKTFLANSITLTPGTLTIDIVDDKLFIHWINIAADKPEEQAHLIVRRFENMLRRIFE